MCVNIKYTVITQTKTLKTCPSLYYFNNKFVRETSHYINLYKLNGGHGGLKDLGGHSPTALYLPAWPALKNSFVPLRPPVLYIFAGPDNGLQPVEEDTFPLKYFHRWPSRFYHHHPHHCWFLLLSHPLSLTIKYNNETCPMPSHSIFNVHKHDNVQTLQLDDLWNSGSLLTCHWIPCISKDCLSVQLK